MKSTVVDESLSSMNLQFCSRENQLLQLLQQNEKPTSIYTRNYGIELLRLLRDWKRLQFRQCNYKNHRIFTLRCLHNDLVPVSIKIKIKSLLDNNAKQLELTRSKIVSILPAPNYQQCQEFIEKIKEKRFNKVKERQVRKLNNLITKMEGVITWSCSQVSLAARASPRQVTGR